MESDAPKYVSIPVMAVLPASLLRGVFQRREDVLWFHRSKSKVMCLGCHVPQNMALATSVQSKPANVGNRLAVLVHHKCVECGHPGTHGSWFGALTRAQTAQEGHDWLMAAIGWLAEERKKELGQET